jgi:hypothetical protein
MRAQTLVALLVVAGLSLLLLTCCEEVALEKERREARSGEVALRLIQVECERDRSVGLWASEAILAFACDVCTSVLMLVLGWKHILFECENEPRLEWSAPVCAASRAFGPGSAGLTKGLCLFGDLFLGSSLCDLCLLFMFSTYIYVLFVWCVWCV